MNKVDNMIEKFKSATEKYPLEEMHPKADQEICHLYGAFKELYNCFSVIRFFSCGLASDYVVETAVKDYDNQFQKFIIPIGESKVPQIFSDYVFALNKEIIQAEQNNSYLKNQASSCIHSLKK